MPGCVSSVHGVGQARVRHHVHAWCMRACIAMAMAMVQEVTSFECTI